MKIKLYEPFQHWYRGGVIWLLGDLHFQKDQEMESYFNWHSAEERLDRINKYVTKNDTFICLGDVGDNLDLISQIKCEYKVLITGNHDKGASNYKRKETVLNLDAYTLGQVKQMKKDGIIDNYRMQLHSPFIEGYISNKLFDEVYNGPLFISDKILLSHERIELPFALNIHGHHHTEDHVNKSVHTVDGKEYISYQINCSADVIDFYPIRLDYIIENVPLKTITGIHDMCIESARSRKNGIK